NQWQLSRGMGGRLRLESVATLVWNTQQASLDLLRSLNHDQSSGGFSSARADPDNKNKRIKTALLIMPISLMLITPIFSGALKRASGGGPLGP
ncbi:hypothetical protein KZZ05_13385, partial [Marinobacter adhaerens]|nr:hypothetical protein [Marinobacter adhaerens]